MDDERYSQSRMVDAITDIKRLEQLRMDDPKTYARAVSAWVAHALIWTAHHQEAGTE